MSDLFNFLCPEPSQSKKSDSPEPSLAHIVDLMNLPPAELEQLNETKRLEDSQHQVFRVLKTIFDELNQLGCHDWNPFKYDKRLAAAVDLYRRWEFEQFHRIKPDQEPVQFRLEHLTRQEYRISRYYDTLFGKKFNMEISTMQDGVTFTVMDWKLKLPAIVGKTGKHLVPFYLYSILLSHVKESGYAEVELLPHLYQINNTTIYPANPDNSYAAYVQYRRDIQTYFKLLKKRGLFAGASEPLPPDKWIASLG